MKILLLTLLLVLLCSTQVLTLRCYTCQGENCKVETVCQDTAQYCKTYSRGDDISRTCEEICVADDFTTCCESDLCET
ncbi:lymphocyte antigen 6D-like [Lates japonicus]|uniref:Lymphocyte antigen 6D-like protein n=1 Tax=Lates japonicus TaxID=270547 RepID=A0AAD3MNN2_LATJO|nr:lymphocyte antigen 6D-like protein [Lates japonicus]